MRHLVELGNGISIGYLSKFEGFAGGYYVVKIVRAPGMAYDKVYLHHDGTWHPQCGNEGFFASSEAAEECFKKSLETEKKTEAGQ